jgi:hypothetical protein
MYKRHAAFNMSIISALFSPESDNKVWKDSFHFPVGDIAQYLKQKLFAISLSVRRHI